MGKVLIIGAGGVGSVVVRKCAQVPEVFSEICLASRTKSKCDAIAADLPRKIETAQVDAHELAVSVRQRKPSPHSTNSVTRRVVQVESQPHACTHTVSEQKWPSPKRTMHSSSSSQERVQ